MSRFGLVVVMKTSIGLDTIFNGHNAAIAADGIPLDTFTPAGAQAFVSIFAAWGLAQATIGLLCLLVLVRYRAMVPCMFSLLLLDHLCRKLIFFVMPIARIEAPPGFFINLALVALMFAGLVLSLRNQDNSQALKWVPVALVVLLRGVNVGGHRTFRPTTLSNPLKHLDAVKRRGSWHLCDPATGSASACTGAI